MRVRFAPSPTGPLHIGGVRTALYNYLLAKQQGGQFIIRVEDTDATRFIEGAEEYIYDSLEWCGIIPDESTRVGGPYAPYKQSERKHFYKQYAEQLLAAGKAYYAFDTEEELNTVREQAKNSGMPNFQYNSITRNSLKNSLSLPKATVDQYLTEGKPYVVRIKMERNVEISFTDEIRGIVSFNTNNLDDKVLFKSDGMPTYHLANVVDDYLMKITHVIRGEEWLPSAPLHVYLYQSFGWESVMPKFAHLPLLLRPDGNGKLSKRDGDKLGFPVFPISRHTSEIDVTGYREAGFLKEGFLNMLALLGWNPGNDEEVLTIERMIETFSLDRVSKSGARFNYDKAKWLNQQHLLTKNLEEVYSLIHNHLSDIPKESLLKMIEINISRSQLLTELIRNCRDLLKGEVEYDEKFLEQVNKNLNKELIQEFIQAYTKTEIESIKESEQWFHDFLETKGLKFGQIAPAIRLALTGVKSGPSIPELLYAYERQVVIERLQNLIK